MMSDTSPSKPGAPWASTSSFKNVSIASMGSPGDGASGPRGLAGRSGASVTAEPIHHLELQHAGIELILREPARLGRDRHDARVCHSGNGVDLETEGLVLGAQTEVHARNTATAEHARGAQPELTDLGRERLGKIRGAEVLAHPRGVL